jgi:hypothetical protein
MLQVAEAIQESLEEIKARQDDIQKMKTDLGLGGDSDADAAIRYSTLLCKNKKQNKNTWVWRSKSLPKGYGVQ